ncbi:ATP-binding protein, partial [Salmonella enterica]|nr:ATP-binding protein [Salmonella enterica]
TEQVAGRTDTWSGRRQLQETTDPVVKNATAYPGQLPTEEWYGCVGDNTLADAILDRLMHNAQRLEMKGESMRKRLAKVD